MCFQETKTSVFVHLDCHNKMPQSGWLKNSIHCLWFWKLKSKIGVLAQLSEALLPPYLRLLAVSSPAGRGRGTLRDLFLRALIPFLGLYLHDLVTPDPHLPLHHLWELGFQHKNLGGGMQTFRPKPPLKMILLCLFNNSSLGTTVCSALALGIAGAIAVYSASSHGTFYFAGI